MNALKQDVENNITNKFTNLYYVEIRYGRKAIQNRVLDSIKIQYNTLIFKYKIFFVNKVCKMEGLFTLTGNIGKLK